MKYGKINIAAGLLFLASFMAYGFLLIYLRDFAPNRSNGSPNTPSGPISRHVSPMFTATCSPF